MTNSEIIAAYSRLTEEYKEFASESKACGFEVPSFEDWAGLTSPRQRAEERWMRAYENDELDLY